MKPEEVKNEKLEQELNDDELDQAAGGQYGDSGNPDPKPLSQSVF